MNNSPSQNGSQKTIVIKILENPITIIKVMTHDQFPTKILRLNNNIT